LWKSVVRKQQQFRKISTTLGVYTNHGKCKALFLSALSYWIYCG